MYWTARVGSGKFPYLYLRGEPSTACLCCKEQVDQGRLPQSLETVLPTQPSAVWQGRPQGGRKTDSKVFPQMDTLEWNPPPLPPPPTVDSVLVRFDLWAVALGTVRQQRLLPGSPWPSLTHQDGTPRQEVLPWHFCPCLVYSGVSAAHDPVEQCLTLSWRREGSTGPPECQPNGNEPLFLSTLNLYVERTHVNNHGND